MRVLLLAIGKTDETYLLEGIKKYLQRLQHYLQFEFVALPDLRQPPSLESQRQIEEGKLILKQLQRNDRLVLLDEKGNTFNSTGFARWLEKTSMQGSGRLVFVIGGPFGFSAEVKEAAISSISLSPLTFSHQMVRLFFVEQLYRACTILKGEKYHHD